MRLFTQQKRMNQRIVRIILQYSFTSRSYLQEIENAEYTLIYTFFVVKNNEVVETKQKTHYEVGNLTL